MIVFLISRNLATLGLNLSITSSCKIANERHAPRSRSVIVEIRKLHFRRGGCWLKLQTVCRALTNGLVTRFEAKCGIFREFSQPNPSDYCVNLEHLKINLDERLGVQSRNHFRETLQICVGS